MGIGCIEEPWTGAMIGGLSISLGGDKLGRGQVEGATQVLCVPLSYTFRGTSLH